MIFLDRPDQTAVDVDASAALDARADVALAGFSAVDLPSALDVLGRATAMIGEPSLSPTLPHTERQFFNVVGDALNARFQMRDWENVVLHGDPWPDGNLIPTTTGLRLIDFGACVGPREWDLSALGDDADLASGGDAELLSWCRGLRSFAVAASCWAQPGRAPGGR
jgi:hypothetical protein